MVIIEASKISSAQGLFDRLDGRVGFARVVTASARVAYLRDVFIGDAHRGLGFGLWTTTIALARKPWRGWGLAMDDALTAHEKAGFHTETP